MAQNTHQNEVQFIMNTDVRIIHALFIIISAPKKKSVSEAMHTYKA